jgi:hypothetical protein
MDFIGITCVGLLHSWIFVFFLFSVGHAGQALLVKVASLVPPVRLQISNMKAVGSVKGGAGGAKGVAGAAKGGSTAAKGGAGAAKAPSAAAPAKKKKGKR